MDHADHVALIRAAIEEAVGRSDRPASHGLWADFGSGRGAFTLALADVLGPGGRIVSVDRDAHALRDQAREVGARFPAVEIRTVEADFTTDLGLRDLAGLVMANALHFQADRERAARHIASMLAPGSPFILVEYDADRGNPWVPYPLSFGTWQAEAVRAGLTEPRLVGRVPSRFLGAIYSAVSERVPG
jgi:SAM-dependent methyltransferase